ncbi:hypothetical protein ABEB36_002563 [Hypothenemus hampei]|uniref:THAP-type domain-containing protein n=1 Tax=Hypothenemus hampei TaxID=57062 RepID=A0ABD1F8T0_HYPHA
MSYCIVNGCKNRTIKKNHVQLANEAKNIKITFHKFPKSLDSKEKWIKALNLENYNLPSSAAVCSTHFKTSDYVPGISKSRLKQDAVPCLTEKERSYIINKAITQNIIIVEPIDTQQTLNMITIQNTQSKENAQNLSVQVQPNGKTGELYMDASTSVSPARIFNSPTKKLMREIHAKEISRIKRKLSVKRYKTKQLKRKLISLKNILKNLTSKGLISNEDSDNLQYMDEERIVPVYESTH